MKTILIIKAGKTVSNIPTDKGDFEHWIMSGMNLSEELFSVCNVFLGDTLPELESLAGIIITGSAAMVTDHLKWSEYTSDYLKHAVNDQIPTLGICYGHQLLAHALGGVVDFHALGREIGTTTITVLDAGRQDPLLKELGTEFPVHVSHSQSVTKAPELSVVLAANPFEGHHIVRFAKNAWGVQFHPEFDAAIMTAYIKQRHQDLCSEGLSVDDLLANVRETPEAKRVLRNFSHIILAEQGMVAPDN